MHLHQRGLTLIELICIVAVAAVLGVIALPPLGDLLERQHVVAAHNRVIAAFSHARLMAMTSRIDTVVCPSRDASTCRSDSIWDQGWITFSDTNRNGRRDAQEPLLRSDTEGGGRIALRSSAGRHRARFARDGRSIGSNLTLRLCAAGGEVRGALVLNNSGRARTASAAEVRRLDACR